MRLVFSKQLIAKSFAGRIENDSEPRGLVVTQELEQHIDHAEHGAGRFALGVGERRKGVESPIEIRRAVDEYEVDLIHDGFLIKAGRWLNTVRLINE